MNSICPVCHHDSQKKVSTQEWNIAGVAYHLDQCDKCGSIFTSPMPTDAVLAEMYRTTFNYNWYRDHYSAKLRDCRSRVAEYSRILGKRVLDFGGGLGYFSRAVKETGRESLTYDPYTTNGISDGEKWDTIVLLHALEHSNELDRTMRQIKSLLAPAGNVIIAVPNLGGRGYKEQGMSWVWAQPPLLHIFHFTALGLTELLRRHGFVNIEVSYKDRWDANTYCDIDNVGITRELDAAWSRQPFAAFSLYRRYIAMRNARYRGKGLRKSEQYDKAIPEQLAELQLNATCAAAT